MISGVTDVADCPHIHADCGKRIRELCFGMRLTWKATIKAVFHTDMNGDGFLSVGHIEKSNIELSKEFLYNGRDRMKGMRLGQWRLVRARGGIHTLLIFHVKKLSGPTQPALYH